MKIQRGFLTFFLSILLFLPAKAGSETPQQPLPPKKIPSQGESPAVQKKAPAAQKEPAPPISVQKKKAIFPLTIEKVQVKSLKEVTGGEEAVVILTGKNLDRVVAAEVLGVQVRILKKTPTGLRLKLTGKGAALKQAAVQVKLRAGAGFKQVPLGNEIRKARLAAPKPEIDTWREDIGKTGAQKETGKITEKEGLKGIDRGPDTGKQWDIPVGVPPRVETKTEAAELRIYNIRYEGSQVFTGQEFRVYVDVHNYGSLPAEFQVQSPEVPDTGTYRLGPGMNVAVPIRLHVNRDMVEGLDFHTYVFLASSLDCPPSRLPGTVAANLGIDAKKIFCDSNLLDNIRDVRFPIANPEATVECKTHPGDSSVHTLVCKGGGALFGHLKTHDERTAKMTLTIDFKKSLLPAIEHPPGTGECAWLDNGMCASEPKSMKYISTHPRQSTNFRFVMDTSGRIDPASVTGSGLILDRDLSSLMEAILSGNTFYVQCSNEGDVFSIIRFGP